jgi:hypothetical protein
LVACALAHRACRNDIAVIYHRAARLFEELALAHGDGRHARMLKNLAKTKLLILDDFGLEPLSAQARHDLFEILEDRDGRTATIVVSQLPVERWHEMLGDPTIADAILDRLVHTAYRIEIKGESMRKLMAPKHAREPAQALAPWVHKASSRAPRRQRHNQRVASRGSLLMDYGDDLLDRTEPEVKGKPPPAADASPFKFIGTGVHDRLEPPFKFIGIRILFHRFGHRGRIRLAYSSMLSGSRFAIATPKPADLRPLSHSARIQSQPTRHSEHARRQPVARSPPDRQAVHRDSAALASDTTLASPNPRPGGQELRTITAAFLSTSPASRTAASSSISGAAFLADQAPPIEPGRQLA